MIDFEKLRQERLNKMTNEEREHEITYDKLVEENIIYKTNTTLVDKYMNVKYGEPVKETPIEVALYRRVNFNTLEVDDKLLLKFHQSPWEYNFDKEFYDSVMKNCTKNKSKQYGLCVDAGGEKYILREECIRIFNECVEVLKDKDIEVCDDYYPSCTELLKQIGWR